ncbi:TetR/AcrR family transcriptional regulator C-terminal domain-containing protein [Paenibacillus sp. HN-1]|uniref:TetR/AcrR family transcriptional regulator n=1 Tax=Paenibacillus TaxID=44249 RepID=UPI001CA9B5AE|nr:MULTISPECIES: TetR/AcrR family transcriptional regulator [Paenibacillus]MBY9078096.1 TetR/AcrR family transcriptional regulator C-terminal domain-containing protein [Paenibacillus sp. CGMCC 1.18879]MBY9083837.1 TetR/AcrR family transcriptional regulator C-terminal domain-containing protein [Paenibacillus sinensis]
MESPKNSKDPRILRTRQLIREAFIELLQEMDIEKITVNRIAERATINRVTFYLHYKDITDMMEKMAEEMVRHIEGMLMKERQAPGAASLDGEWTPLVQLLEHIAKHSKFYKVVLTSRRTPIFTERLLRLLTGMVTERIEHYGGDELFQEAGIQKEIAIWYHSSALIGLIIAWLRKDMPYSPHYVADQYNRLRSHIGSQETGRR